MTSVLTGFSDADAWMRCADGTIVGRARDRSYKEVVRGGVPIEVFVADVSAPEVESCVIAPIAGAAETAYRTDYDDEHDKYADCDFEQYFAPVVPRNVARARRLAAKKPVKMPKYGPKVSKAHTVAARVLAAPVEPTSYAAPVKRCCGCKRAQQADAYGNWDALLATKTCELCDSAWVAQLGAIQADIAVTIEEITAYEEELRAEQRMRDARYRD